MSAYAKNWAAGSVKPIMTPPVIYVPQATTLPRALRLLAWFTALLASAALGVG
jgi:CBS domain-containing protein